MGGKGTRTREEYPCPVEYPRKALVSIIFMRYYHESSSNWPRHHVFQRRGLVNQRPPPPSKKSGSPCPCEKILRVYSLAQQDVTCTSGKLAEKLASHALRAREKSKALSSLSLLPSESCQLHERKNRRKRLGSSRSSLSLRSFPPPSFCRLTRYNTLRHSLKFLLATFLRSRRNFANSRAFLNHSFH